MDEQEQERVGKRKTDGSTTSTAEALQQEAQRVAREAQAQLDTPPTADAVVLGVQYTFNIAGKELVVKPLVLGDYQRMGTLVGELGQQLVREHPDLDLDHPEQHLATVLPLMVDGVITLFSRVFEVDAAWVMEHVTMEDASAIILAMVQANRLPAIVGNFRRALQAGRTVLGTPAGRN